MHAIYDKWLAIAGISSVTALLLSAQDAFALDVVVGSEVINSQCYVVPGNGPYGQPHPNLCANSPGTTTLGPASGTLGGNTTGGHLAVANGPLPSLKGDAIGFDDGTIYANASYTFIQSTLSYDFTIAGPTGSAPVFVPIEIQGSTYGTVGGVKTASFSGTRLTLSSTNSLQNLHLVGTQGGTAADIYQPNGNVIDFSWGKDYLNGVTPYTDYSASFLYGASILSSATYVPGQNSVLLHMILQGSSSVSDTPLNAPVTGTASAGIDPYIYIDPTWLAAHPEYTLIVDSAVGNSPVVPLPAAAWLFGSGLIGLTGVVRKRKAS